MFGVTQFYEHGYDAEQLHGKNIVEGAKAAGVKHLIWSTVEGREGECSAISWKSKALIEDRIIASGIPWTFVYIPNYYENFWTSFFAPSYSEEKGFNWSVGFLPDVPIFSFSVSDLGAWVVPAFRETAKYTGIAYLRFTNRSELIYYWNYRQEGQIGRRLSHITRPRHPVQRSHRGEGRTCLRAHTRAIRSVTFR